MSQNITADDRVAAQAFLRRELLDHVAEATPPELEATLDTIAEALQLRAGTRSGFVAAALETVRQWIRQEQDGRP